MSELLDEIKRRVDLLSLIGKYTRVVRKGNRYWACCPFHQEKTPSFTINPEEGFFKCFGCGVGGNAVKFVQFAENLEFPEALNFLARELSIDPNQFRKFKQSPELKSERDYIHKAHSLAASFFNDNLYRSSFGQSVQEYLTQRQISSSIARTFGLGVSLDSWQALSEYLSHNGISTAAIVKGGLGSYSESEGRLFDRFRARLMFPIKDRHGQVIAFGGRAIKKDDEPKYLNSGTTPIYDKSNTLYGLDLSASEIRQQKSVVLVEGYIDLISLWIAGVKNVVASCGTALTPTQAKTISRLSDTILICYDGDNAGIDATIKAARLFIEIGFLPKAIRLPSDQDPDDIRLKLGKDTLLELIRQPVSSIEFICRNLMHKNGTEPEAKKRTLDTVTDIIKLSPEPLYIEDMSVEAAAILNINVEVILSKLPRSKPVATISPNMSPSSISIEQDLEVEILSLMARDRGIRDQYKLIFKHSLTEQNRNTTMLNLWQLGIDYEEYPEQSLMAFFDSLVSSEHIRIKNSDDVFWALIKLIQFSIDKLEGIASTQIKSAVKNHDEETKQFTRDIKSHLLELRKVVTKIKQTNELEVLAQLFESLDLLEERIKKKGDPKATH